MSSFAIVKWDPTLKCDSTSCSVNELITAGVTFPANVAVESTMGSQSSSNENSIYMHFLKNKHDIVLVALYCAQGKCVFDDLVVIRYENYPNLTPPLNCFWCNTKVPQPFIWGMASDVRIFFFLFCCVDH